MTHVDRSIPLVATLVSDRARLTVLPRYFGKWDIVFELAVCQHLRELSPDYEGGEWQYFTLGNGGFYMAPPGQVLRIVQPHNGFDETVSADAAGIIATLYALSHLSFHHPDEALFSTRFHALRAYALDHAEARQILRAID